MKYFAKTLFDATTFNSANTAGTSSQFDTGEAVTVWMQMVGTGTSTSTDMSVQLQVSNDPISKVDIESTWINQDSANTFSQTNGFVKYMLGSQKARVVVTRTAGTAILTLRVVGKPVSVPQISGTSSGTNTGDVTITDFGSSPNSAGASLSGQILTIQPASATQPGAVSNSAQSFLGTKTFLNGVVAASVTVNSSGIPANGIYLPSANTLGFAAASTLYGSITSAGLWAIGATSGIQTHLLNGALTASYLTTNIAATTIWNHTARIGMTSAGGAFAGSMYGLGGVFRFDNTNTQNWTNAVGDAGVGVYAELSALTATPTGTVTSASALQAKLSLSATNMTFTRAFGLQVRSPVGGATITSLIQAGIARSSAGANNINLWLGYDSGDAAPSGNYGIYLANTAASQLGGSLQAASFIPSGSTIPSNGLYLPTTNTPAIAANSAAVATFASTGVSLKGATSSNDATTGDYGFYIETVISSASNFGTTAQLADAGSVVVPSGGDWMATVSLTATANGATCTSVEFGLSTSSGNDATGLLNGDSRASIGPPTALANSSGMVRKRYLLGAGATYFFKVRADYTGGPPQYTGKIFFERRR